LKIWRFEISFFPMDRKQLVTIAITAVTSVIAKEVISWLAAWFRSSAQTQTAREKARTIFNKSNLMTLGVVVWFGVTGFALWSKLHETSPITRRVVASIVVSMVNFGFALLLLGFNFGTRFYDWKDRKNAPN